MTFIPVPLIFATCAGLFTVFTPAYAITDGESDSIVAAEIAAEKDRRSERRARLLEVPATRETVHQNGEETIVIRRVDPPDRIHNMATPDERESAEEESGKSPAPKVADKPEINLTLIVSVSSEGSRIRARTDGNETEYTVISRIITHLPGIFSVETADVRYQFIAIVTPVDAIATTPRSEAGYQIYSDGAPVSKSFESAMAALHEHALEHQTEWIAEAERAKTLQNARGRNRTENPPEPRVTTINVWRSRPASTDTQDVGDR